MVRNASIPLSRLALALALLVGGLSGCTQHVVAIRTVPVHADTRVERKETIEEMRAAWHNRERLDGLQGRRTELRFLVHLAGAVNQYKHTESYGDICHLWNQCLREHLYRFPESGA